MVLLCVFLLTSVFSAPRASKASRLCGSRSSVSHDVVNNTPPTFRVQNEEHAIRTSGTLAAQASRVSPVCWDAEPFDVRCVRGAALRRDPPATNGQLRPGPTPRPDHRDLREIITIGASSIHAQANLHPFAARREDAGPQDLLWL
jgi:hypothetical protein